MTTKMEAAVNLASLSNDFLLKTSKTESTAPKNTTTNQVNWSLLMMLKSGFFPMNVYTVATVINTANTSTVWIDQRSNFQALIFLLDN